MGACIDLDVHAGALTVPATGIPTGTGPYYPHVIHTSLPPYCHAAIPSAHPTPLPHTVKVSNCSSLVTWMHLSQRRQVKMTV